MSSTARRALLGSVVAGGLVATQVAPAPAAGAAAPVTAWTPKALKVTDVKAGDLVIGPDGNAARLAAVTRLSSGRVKVDAMDLHTGRPVPLDATVGSTGHPTSRKLLVLARGVAATAVLFAAQPEPGRVIDGGGP